MLVKWDSIKEEYVSFFIYCENDKLRLRRMKMIESESDIIIHEAFDSTKFETKELKKLFIKIMREYVTGK